MNTGAKDIETGIAILRGPLKTMVNIVVLGSFLFYIFMPDIGGALGKSGDILRTGTSGTGAPRLIERFDPAKFDLPSDLGKISYRHIGNSDKTVILIQDAHCDLNVQKTISDVIGHVRSRYGIESVNLEGGCGGYDLSLFDGIEDVHARLAVAEYFLKNGMLNGAEFFAVKEPGKIALWGVEDRDLYLKNLAVYRASLASARSAGLCLDAFETAAEKLKKDIYNAGLAELDSIHADYRGKRIDISAYLSYLLEKTRERSVTFTGYPNLELLRRTIEIEEDIDFEKANKERDDLVEKLRKNMSAAEAAELDRNAGYFKAGDITRADFYGYLLAKAEELGMARSSMSNFDLYGEYVATFNKVDALEAKNEILQLEREARDALCDNDDQRSLCELSERIMIMRDFLGFRLTEEEYDLLAGQTEGSDVGKWAAFLAAKTGEPGTKADLEGAAMELAAHIGEAGKFYELSLKRNISFLENIRFGEKGARAAVLVTGGFHTGKIQELLGEKGISCVTVTPAFHGACPDPNPYYSILSGGKDPVSEAVTAFISNLQVPSPFTSLAFDAWKRSDRSAIRMAGYIVGRLNLTRTPFAVVGPEGAIARFLLKDGQVVVQHDPEFVPDNEEVMSMDDILADLDEAEEADRAARIEAGREERIKTPVMIKVGEPAAPAPEAPAVRGMARLIGQLRDLAACEDKDVPRTAAIADLHGNMERFRDVMGKVPPGTDELVLLGDYMDRGNAGLKVMQEVVKLRQERGAVTLMGNHELLFMMTMMGSEDAFERWIDNKGLDVLEEAGYKVEEPKRVIREAYPGFGTAMLRHQHEKTFKIMLNSIRQNPEFISLAEWMKKNLLLYHISRNGTLYMHAGLPMDGYANLTLKYPGSDGFQYEGLAAVARIEEEMQAAFDRDDLEAEVLRYLLRGKLPSDGDKSVHSDRKSVLWVRCADVESTIAPDLMYDVLPGREMKVLDKLGVAYMVTGHTPVAGEKQDIVDLAGRIFFIDRFNNENEGVVMFNNDEGLQYLRKAGSVRKALTIEEFRARRNEARQRAALLAGELETKYIAPGAQENNGADTDLIGKLYDREGELVTAVNVVFDAASMNIKLTDPADGSSLYDKHGDAVGELALFDDKDIDMITVKDKAYQGLLSLRKALTSTPEDARKTSMKVLDGAIDVLRRAKVHIFNLNDHGVLGACCTRDGTPHIFLSSSFLYDGEMAEIGIFHEAAELFLAGTPELVPAGLSAHELLRGASKKERQRNPSSFRTGVQDELFGELNEDFSYWITKEQDEYLTEDEARFIWSVLRVCENRNVDAIRMLTDRRLSPEPVSGQALRRFLGLRKEFAAVKAAAENSGDKSLLEKDPYYRALRVIQDAIKGSEDHKARYFTAPDSAVRGIASPRVQRMGELKDAAGFKTMQTMRAREIEKLKRTIAKNLGSAHRNGAVAELPSNKELILVGDLHCRIDNLRDILAHNGNLARIRRGEAILVFLGDAPHPDPEFFHWSSPRERYDRMMDMTSSEKIMRFIMRLKRENPNNVYYVLGNHDYLSGKGGKYFVQQGLEMRKHLARCFGDEYVEAYEGFVASNVIMAKTSDGLVATHAAPIRNADSLDEIRHADLQDEDDPIVHEAMWLRWKDKNPDSAYSEDDVNIFLKKVGGRILVVAHTKEHVKPDDFQAELIKDKHYVTMAAGDISGYLSYKGRRLEAVNVTKARAYDETALSEGVKKVVEEEEKKSGDESLPSYEERLKKFEERFGPLKIIGTLGAGKFGTVFEVENDDGERFALKVAGGSTVNAERQLKRARLVVKTTDVAFGVIMAEASREEKSLYMRRIIDAGICGDEPYIATEVLAGHHEIDRDLLSSLDKEEILSIADQIMRACVRFKSKGLVIFDMKLGNFAYKDKKVVLMDMGSCAVDASRTSAEKIKKLEDLGIKTIPRHMDDQRIREQIVEGLWGLVEEKRQPEISREELGAVCRKAQTEEDLAVLYGASGEALRNLRISERPVVVFLKQSGGAASVQFMLIKALERKLRKTYSGRDIGVMVYDGTREGLEDAKARAKEMLDRPGARAVVYVPEEMHPGRIDGNTIYITEDSAEEVLTVAGPRVALALAMVNYADGKASPELMISIEQLIKLMVDDAATLENITEHGLDNFLKNLIRGFTMLKMKKIDIEEMRTVVETQEAFLQSL